MSTSIYSDSAVTIELSPLEIVLKTIEEEIVLGQLHPMERLIEDELMERFSCKRHIIRQALQQLEVRGMVARIPNRGAHVRSYTLDEVIKLYEMRELLETAAAKRIPLPAESTLIKRLQEIQLRHSLAVDKHDFRAAFHTNLMFHKTLYNACGNSYLADSINDYSLSTHPIRFSTTTDINNLKRSRDEHLRMIDALESGDRESLIELCRLHLLPSRDRYIELYRLREAKRK